MTMQDDETKTAQCLFGKKGTQAKEVEDKFATYWPRNIMILFGPPGVFFLYIRYVILYFILIYILVYCSIAMIINNNGTNQLKVPEREHMDLKLRIY